MSQQPVLLTGYDAKRCARRIHNEWDPSIEKVEWEVPASLQMRFDAGIAFEVIIFNELEASLADSRYVDLSDVRGKANAIAATIHAMEDDVDVILGGWLPDETEGGRTGRPDILLSTSGGYLPGDVKGHRIVARRAKGTLSYSTIEDPSDILTANGLACD